ncbi:3-deoxy-7-phosphoheptulonate synthase [Acinetobacter rathckeae]|uniref:3-deoxy-7-phosphoheptulonate synthase n=1 Tax=Acinetobacter rathckeae TaxID=2605272 RepID=UPI0018A2DC3B|nr:3-deoxy-7-phosphoheptulonate synthase [Acinetobacter rathckeae]MBF7687194.1 3-deoxy-7-phosphoheptulonate synthase [Acinetobacter rathckeae]MBF7694453.1 3-deoxy-7-phosphoheptulonate synthase [Acinetobacter rathckeae]
MNTVVTPVQEQTLPTPQQLKKDLPLSSTLKAQITQHRRTVDAILAGQDDRLLLIMGPCSIHDPVAVVEYAKKLQKLQLEVKDRIFIVMRAYIEKPRTTVGWKGFLYDPMLDGSANLKQGIEKSRALYLELVAAGIPIASEILNPMATGYFDDLIAWGAIGARTSESQIHREISSSLPFAVGFKNGTDGSVQIALDAIQSAAAKHDFFALGQHGGPVLKSSLGNPFPHLILRGANTGTNYDAQSVQVIKEKVGEKMPALVIDCSHGNSGKDPLKQPAILKQIVAERALTQVRGVMVESHLLDGAQKISTNMTYGQSVTDGCLGWEKTEQLVLQVYSDLSA